MKILLINKYHYKKGGAERAYFDMADILTAAGHTVAFFSMEHPKNETTPWSKYFVSEVDYQNASYSLFQKLRVAFRMIWNPEANKKLAALIDDFQPDVAHAHNIYHQISPSIFHVLKRKRVPIVLTLHDYKLISPNYNLYTRGKIWDHSSGWLCLKDRCVQESFASSLVCAVEKWTHTVLGSYKLIDVLISPSQFLADKVVSLGWRGTKIHVLPNPLRKEEMERGTSENTPQKNKLVFFGRLSPEKGVEQVLSALVKVPEKELTIIGEGPSKETLAVLAEELGITKRVHFRGAHFGKELESELQSAEAVVVPSVWYENLPYVVTESLSLGLVVIAAASGGISERIVNGKNGFLYPLHDTEALTSILKELEQHDLETIRINAKKSVLDLDPTLFRTKLEDIYKSLP